VSALKQCPNCGVFVDPGATSCDVCGASLTPSTAEQTRHPADYVANQADASAVLASAHADAPSYHSATNSAAAPWSTKSSAADDARDASDPSRGATEAVDDPQPLDAAQSPTPAGAEARREATPAAGESSVAPGISSPPVVAAAAPSRGPSAADTKQAGPVKWIAEVWVDPEWFRLQQSPDQLPSPGVPRVIGLRSNRVLIGRPSPGQPVPDIDCVADSGVSRRQAQLISDGIRWFLEDLGSSNGTFVGQVDRPLPTQPIRGRVEVSPHDRIYVGSWTRIVIRPALKQEAEL